MATTSLIHRSRALLAGALATIAALALLPPVAGAAAREAESSSIRGDRVALASNEALTPARLAAREVASRPQAKAAAPTPSAAPAPVPPVAAPPAKPDVNFVGDQISDFQAQSAPGAITEAPDPAGSGETVFKMSVSDSDGYPVTPTENPRAELISPFSIEAGDEIWWSASFFLPADFPASTPNFVTLLQGPYGPPASASPPFHIEANSGVLKWQRNGTYNWDIPWQMPQVQNQWVEVMVHERFASDGWVEMWVNGQQVTFFASSPYNPSRIPPTTKLEMATMDGSNGSGPQAIFLQQYRKKGMFSSLTVYQGPLRIGTTREAVEG